MATEPFNTFVTGAPAAAAITGSELVPVIQGGSTVKTTPAALLTYIDANASIPAGQVTGLAASATTDTTNASNISSGTLAIARLPAAVVGDLQYQGTWNALTNTPTLVSGVGTQGFYYKVSVAGVTNLDGNAVWNVGDSAVFDGTVWDKLAGGGPNSIPNSELAQMAANTIKSNLTGSQANAADNTLAAVRSALGVGLSTDVQIFNGSGTWTAVAAGYKAVRVITIGGGGGGGGGTTTASGTANSGGGGGGGGASWDEIYPASAVTSPQTVTIGSGGTAGTAGGSGQQGGNTTFGSLQTGWGGGGGAVGQSGTTSGGGGGGGTRGAGVSSTSSSGGSNGTTGGTSGGAGAAGAASSNMGGSGGGGGTSGAVGGLGVAPAATFTGGCGGAAGGGVSTTPATFAGGPAQIPNSSSTNAAGSAGSGGNGGAGTSGTAPSGGFVYGSGGAGGGAAISTFTGGVGGAGATGSGGGGGGSALTTGAAGAGGVGGGGQCVVITYF